MKETNKLSVDEMAKDYADLQYGDPAKFVNANQLDRHCNCIEDFKAGYAASQATVGQQVGKTGMERFVKPTDKQIVSAAILFNDGKIENSKLSDMVALCDWVIDRLYENGDIQIPSSKENK